MADKNRVYDGFSVLKGGMNGGDDASLIGQDQCSLAVNFTFRGSFASVRPPFSNLVFSFDNPTTNSNFFGVFQGACFYESPQFGQSGFVVAVGGRLFRITLAPNSTDVSDITPQVQMMTISDVAVPNVGSNATINLNIVGVAVGQSIIIAGTQWNVISILSNSIVAEYMGGILSDVASGTAVFNYLNHQTSILTTALFTPPAVNGSVNITVNNTSELSTQILYIFGGEYEIQVDGIADNNVTAKYIGTGGPAIIIPTGTVVTDVTTPAGTNSTTGFTFPVLNANVVIPVVSSAGMVVGDTLTILTATFVIQPAGIAGNNVTCKYTVLPTDVPSGWNIYNYSSVLLSPNVSVGFTIPAINSLVIFQISSSAGLQLFQLIIKNGSYIVTAVNSGTSITAKFLGVTIPTGTIVEDSNGNTIYVYATLPALLDFCDIFQAENYAVILAGQNQPRIYDGSTSFLTGIKQLPPAVLGTYAWGRIWLALNDRKSFIASDLVGSQSGTPQKRYRDAILNVTENTFLNGGGAFSVPSNSGLITAMSALPMLDTSLGIGPVLVGTENSVLSCNAPTDRTTWQNLTYPIETISALDYGPVAPKGFVAVNSDMWYRSIDGYRSFLAARLDFNASRNTPNSQEINPILDADAKQLLFYGSEMLFDNKLFATVSPYRTPYGVAHRGLVVLNFDEVSNLREKSPPAWEGVSTGLQILRVVKGVVDGVERGFAFVLNTEGFTSVVPTSGIPYVLMPPETAVIPVVKGYTYTILAGTNEDGTTLTNGSQSFTMTAGVTYTIIAQSNSIIFTTLSSLSPSDKVTAVVTLVIPANSVELWEFLPKGKYDQYKSVSNGIETINRTRIESVLETGRRGFDTPEMLKGIYTAEIYLDEIVDNVSLAIKFRPDEYPVWTDWTTLNFCVTNSQCTLSPKPAGGQCQIWTEKSAQYAARIMLPSPPEVENPVAGGYLHEGYEFQFRIEGAGSFRIRKFKVHAKIRSDKMEGEVPPDAICTALAVCNSPIYGYNSHG